jgi:signal transduction histidine kinase/ActR/RegA family two-component response regulator
MANRIPDLRDNTLPVQFAASAALLAISVGLIFFSLLSVANDARKSDKQADQTRALIMNATDARLQALNADPGDANAVRKVSRLALTAATLADNSSALGAGTAATIRSNVTSYITDPEESRDGLVQALTIAVNHENASASDDAGNITRAIALGAIGVVGVIITVLLFGRGMLRSILRPIREVAKRARRLGAGDLNTRVPEIGVADVKELAHSVNSVAIALEAKRKTLEQQHQQISWARAETNRANLAKNEFLSRMSHELRTPLNAILGFAQLLELDDLDPRQRDNVAHIVSGGRHLLDLINEVLEITRIEAGSMSPVIEPVRATDVITSAIELVSPLAAQRGIELAGPAEGQADLWVEADEQRLKQVLLNLLANAVKYNRDGGSVTVSLKQLEGRARIEVTDTGQGIPQDQLPKLFIPFERLGAESTGVEGTGLGLVLALRLMEAMNGTLGVESQPWIGSTFHVELPLGEAPADAPAEPLPPRLVAARPEIAAEGACRRVLYIEDDPANAHLMAQLFAEEPRLELMTTMYGKLGIELARQHHPDLVLLDVNLPDLGGDDVIKRLRSDEMTRDIPVIAVSADATSESRARLTALGAARYLTKPITLNVVMTAVWEVLDEPMVAA